MSRRTRATGHKDIIVDANYGPLDDDVLTFIKGRLSEAAQRGEEFVNLVVVHLQVATPAFAHEQKKRMASGVRVTNDRRR